MLHRRVKNRGLIRDFAARNGLVQAHRQLLQQLCQQLPDPHRRICAITSAGAGEGRSTLALNLAETAARETRSPVLLLDADTESPSLHQPFNLPPGPGLCDVVVGKVQLDDALRPVGTAGVALLACGDEPLGAVALAECAKVGELLNVFRSRFAWVFVDTAALFDAPGVAGFVRQADGVVLAVRWSRTRAQLISRAADKLDAAGAPTLGVVLTQRCFSIPSYIYRRL